jgi:hypothetical protein
MITLLLGQVVAAFAFALGRGWISTTLQLAHKQPCALISFAAGTLLQVTRRNLVSAAPFREWSPAIFAEFELT